MKRQIGRTNHCIATLVLLVLFAAGCGDSGDTAAVDAMTDTASSAAVDTASDATESVDDVVGSEMFSITVEESMADSSAVAEGAVDDAVAEDAVDDAVVEDAVDDAVPVPIIRLPQPELSAGLLTAGEIDDNLNFDFFSSYLDRVAQGYGQQLPRPDLRERITVHVVDSDGRSMPNLALQFFDEFDNAPYLVHTNSAGIARFFPLMSVQSWTSFNVNVAGATTVVTKEDAAQGTVTITADGPLSDGTPNALDVALVLDVTGSMSDELSYLTTEFESIIERLRGTYPNADLRFGLVSYRDEGDDFVTQVFDFTSSVAEMQDYLSSQRADGGGDYPEAMDAALEDANQLSWRDGNVARVIILNADAPPHDEDLAATLDASAVSAQKGIRIYPLAASGVADTAEYMMRIMAVTTGGRHLFLTADSGIGGEKQEPKTQCYQVTQLDSLLLRVLESELAGERIDAHPSEIIREVGNYERGVCVDG